MSENNFLNRRGFAVLETILIVIIVGLLAGVGWYIYDSNKKTNSALDSAASVNQQSAISGSKSSKFVFKELGVQITLPDSLKGLSYRAENGVSVTGKATTFLYLTSDNFKAFLDSCKATDKTATFAGISKAQGTYPTNPTPENSDGALLKQFDGFYIEGSADQQSNPCASDSSAQSIENIRSTQFANLEEAFKTATIVQ